jgi:hypothetical protein
MGTHSTSYSYGALLAKSHHSRHKKYHSIYSTVARDIEGNNCLISLLVALVVIAVELCMEGVFNVDTWYPFATDHVVHLSGACHGACRFCHHVLLCF